MTFKRGSVQIRRRGSRKFELSLRNIKSLRFDEKSVNVYAGEAEAQIVLEMANVDESRFVKRFLSSDASGTVNFTAKNAGSVHVEGSAFDILSAVRMDHVRTLDLKPFGLKQNRPPASSLPEFHGFFNNVSIPTIPTDSFPSSRELTFRNCKISDVELNSFSGFNMGKIYFEESSVDRLHGHSFPDKSLVEELKFEACSISSVSPKAVVSAMSLLTITSTLLSSISRNALDCQAAKINLTNNTFTTLSEDSFKFRSWTDLIVDDNDFQFLEVNSLAGIEFSNSSKNFFFRGNRIHYANQKGLLVESPADKAVVSGNVFTKECDCEFEKWLSVVAGGNNDFSTLMINSSLCRVPGFSADCYKGDFVRIVKFKMFSCSGNDAKCQTSGLKLAWDFFQEQIEVKTNKGILLIVLLFSLASCFVVGILTFFRWIVFVVTTRDDPEVEDQWNFTKVEERLQSPDHEDGALIVHDKSSPSSSGGGERHYESLPLTTTEVLVESQASSPKTEIPAVAGVVEDLKPPDVLEQVPAGEKPKQQTFYDEMICLLKEKLEDPDNYATVADNGNAKDGGGETQHLLYQDPHDISGSGD